MRIRNEDHEEATEWLMKNEARLITTFDSNVEKTLLHRLEDNFDYVLVNTSVGVRPCVIDAHTKMRYSQRCLTYRKSLKKLVQDSLTQDVLDALMDNPIKWADGKIVPAYNQSIRAVAVKGNQYDDPIVVFEMGRYYINIRTILKGNAIPKKDTLLIRFK